MKMKDIVGFLLFILFAGSVLIAVLPEPPARSLIGSDDWNVNVPAQSKILLAQFPEQFRLLRRSAIESADGVIYRSWTPSAGIVPVEVISKPFVPARYMSVAVTGSSRSARGLAQAYIECESNHQRMEVFKGSVNVNVSEATVATAADWCPGTARLTFISTENDVNVGVGSVYETSLLSHLKSSFIGRIPYFTTAIIIFSFIMFSWASLASRLRLHHDPLPLALASLGAASLAAFFLSSFISKNDVAGHWQWICPATIGLITTIFFYAAGADARSRTARSLAQYAKIWAAGSLVYFALLCLTYNGLGSWEPNYRFWPATWSSDNQLPWIFAEAIRHGTDLQGLLGGEWRPTDRPPLMTGAHLLLSSAFELLQVNNDGNYLQGAAYNAAAVLLNSLWIPVIWWILSTLASWLDKTGRTAILVLVGCLPFVLFNTVYGWPKAFGAAYALIAFALAWQTYSPASGTSSKSTILLCAIAATFSLLAHMSTALFLAPLGLLVLIWNFRRNHAALAIGLGIALALLGSWSLYKSLVLPSFNPVTKYALTGDYGFGRPDVSLWHMVSDRYGDMSFLQWLQIKKAMMLQAFIPAHNSIAPIDLNSDFGANFVDKLRAWDFMLLSKGNAPTLLFSALTIWVLTKIRVLGFTRVLRQLNPFILLVCISISAWLLIVLIFFAPPVLAVWPQAALFGLALGGSVVVYSEYPSIFRVALISTIAYTGVVWIISPLQHALRIDTGAAITLVTLLALYLQYTLLQTPSALRVQSGTATNAFSSRKTLIELTENPLFKRFTSAPAWSVLLKVIAAGCFAFASYITLRYIDQPLADTHAFRQTQTALTSYWMLQEGWQLAYQTPVMGYPWSVPFEFPLYQMLVAAIVAVTGFDLEAVGRFVSFIFLAASAWPAFAISSRLKLPPNVPWVFCALLWSSPLSVYWGRTFMIETTALFFAFACLPFGIDLIRRHGGWKSVLLFLLTATAAVLQKSTTGGPVLLLLGLCAVLSRFRMDGLNVKALRRSIYAAVIIGIPLAIGLIWTHYTDSVKLANPMGSQLTSQALTTWNFGTLKQKLDIHTWILVVWHRSLGWNAGGGLGLLLLVLPWIAGREYRRFAWLSLGAITLFLLPILIFTNVHVVHEYYQMSCVAFLLAALAIVIGAWLPAKSSTTIAAPIVTIIIVLLNFSFFSRTYGVVSARTLEELDPRSVQAYQVGRYLREHTLPGTGLVVFGQGYSSEIALQSQRKTMAVPDWFKEYKELWEHPEKYLGDVQLSAIAICPLSEAFPNGGDLEARIKKQPEWVHRTVQGCELLLSPKYLVK